MEEVPQGWTAIQTLGRGSFGEVKLLVNHRTEDAVAMKVVDTSRARRCADSVKHEARIHGALDHPNIVHFFERRREGPTVYLFLEYCSGGELFDRLKPDVGLDEREAHRYFQQLIAAVEYLHGVGVSHRDIKPENILLDDEDNLKLADFGLAAVFRREGDRGERLFSGRCGSPDYMAPEILVPGTWFRARPVDVWACGVVLAVMLTGEMPWEQPVESCQEYQDWLEEKIYLPPWNKIRSAPLGLLSKLLLPSPEGRISIPDIKKHPWFTQKTHTAG